MKRHSIASDHDAPAEFRPNFCSRLHRDLAADFSTVLTPSTGKMAKKGRSGGLTLHSQEAGAIPRAEERKMRERATKRSEKTAVLRQVSHNRGIERICSRERSWTLHSAGNIMKGYIYGIRKPLSSANLVHWCRFITYSLRNCKQEELPEVIVLERGALSSSLALQAELSGKRLVVLFLWPQSVIDSVSHR